MVASVEQILGKIYGMNRDILYTTNLSTTTCLTLYSICTDSSYIFDLYCNKRAVRIAQLGFLAIIQYVVLVQHVHEHTTIYSTEIITLAERDSTLIVLAITSRVW
jgi:hypothetical protein